MTEPTTPSPTPEATTAAEPRPGRAALPARPLTASADVATDAPARYAKQLGSHLGRKSVFVPYEDGSGALGMPMGDAVLLPGDGVRRLEVGADDEESLERIKGVVGGHLERFGQRHELVVRWA